MYRKQRRHRSKRRWRQDDFEAADAGAFHNSYRKYTTPVEVVRFGKTIGYWVPIAPWHKGEPVYSVSEWDPNGYRAPFRGSVAWRRLKPYLDAIEEAEHNERALAKALRDYSLLQHEAEHTPE